MMLATLLALEDKPSDEEIALLEKRLADVIKEYVEKNGSMILTVDYEPDDILSKITEECGISSNCFPWKTTMRIQEDEVSVIDGYAAAEKIIFKI